MALPLCHRTPARMPPAMAARRRTRVFRRINIEERERADDQHIGQQPVAHADQQAEWFDRRDTGVMNSLLSTVAVRPSAENTATGPTIRTARYSPRRWESGLGRSMRQM